MNTLFSNRCNKNTTPITTRTPYIPKCINATNAAAKPPINGHIYGINSVIATIPASAHF
jgi:hypothetical protein